MTTTAPTAYALTAIVSDAMRTLEMLRSEHGQVIDTDDELLAALAEENVPVKHLLTLLVRSSMDDKAMGEAMESRIADMRQRRERFARAEQTKRAVIQQVMEAVGLKSVREAEFTLSLSAGKPKVIVTNPELLPDHCVTITVTRTPDKAATKAAIEDRLAVIRLKHEAGEEPPPELEGAMLSNATTVLRILSK